MVSRRFNVPEPQDARAFAPFTSANLTRLGEVIVFAIRQQTILSGQCFPREASYCRETSHGYERSVDVNRHRPRGRACQRHETDPNRSKKTKKKTKKCMDES